MKFPIKLMIGGVGAVFGGICLTVDGLSGNQELGGLWRGPLLVLFGIAAIFFGNRFRKAASEYDSQEAIDT